MHLFALRNIKKQIYNETCVTAVQSRQRRGAKHSLYAQTSGEPPGPPLSTVSISLRHCSLQSEPAQHRHHQGPLGTSNISKAAKKTATSSASS